MPKLSLTLFLLFLFSQSPGQEISFTYQAGLTSSIHRIIPVPSSNTILIAERNGGILAWDITANRILCKLTTVNTEIADMIYCPKDKKIVVAGSEGVEVFNAAKLLTDHSITPDFHYSGVVVSGLFWNESNNTLRAITNDGELLNFAGFDALRNQKPSSRYNTGLADAFALREIGNRICVLGRQQQAFFTTAGKRIFSATNNSTGMFGHAFNAKDSAIYLAHESGIIRLDYSGNRFRKSTYSIPGMDPGALVLGITIDPETGQVFAGTNRNKVFSLSPKANTVTEIFNSPDGSFTSLLVHSDRMLVGDFFGNVIVLDPGSGEKMFQLNEDATPSLNGVYLDRKNRMVSTHFGLRGFALKVWDLPTAALAKSFNVRGDIAYDVGFSASGDTVYSGHTDNAVYRYYRDGEHYKMDTLVSPERTFMYGSIFFNVELDRKSRREKVIKEFTEMLDQPGILAFPADSANSLELVFVNSLEVPEECRQGKLPSNYRVPEACLAAVDLIRESSGWDLLDKDLFYMRACSSPTLQMFLERVAEKGVDTAKAARFYRVIKGIEKISPFFYINSVTESKTLQTFVRKQQPLYADISRMPEMALFFYPDSLVAWNGLTRQVSTLHTGYTDMDFYYDFNEHYVALADGRSGTISLLQIMPAGRASATRWISFGEEDYLVHNRPGYYKIRGRTNRINFSIDRKPLSFHSFDLKYNRPDLVIADVGAGDSTLIAAYRAAALKRIRRSGLTVSSRQGAGLPVLDFENREEIPYRQENEILRIHLKGGDSLDYIDRFNLWVNEVPLFGSHGHSILARQLRMIDTILEIRLSPGENRLETALITSGGIESYRRPMMVNYATPAAPANTLHFIGIGIDRFQDAKYNLQYSVKDIRDLAASLKKKYGSNSIVIDTLFNEQVTASNINALKQRLQLTGINDRVIISYSGHGLLSRDFDYYLSTYPVSFENPKEQGLPYDELENLVDSIPARRKLILIDACHSGEVDKEDLVALDATPDSLIKGLKPVAYRKNSGNLGLKNSFELMQSLFINVGKSTGATIISAAAGTQFALERNDLRNGVFTYAILEAMEKHETIRVSELREIVGERVLQLTRGLQKPTSRSETAIVDWKVW